jgi:transcriptional regulator with XRE-family HTH domain
LEQIVPERRTSPTVGRRRLGIELRRLRDQAGITIEAVAEQLECSSSKISRIETGHIGVTPRDVRDLLAIYGVEGEAAEEWLKVAREAREKGWWQGYGAVLRGAYVAFESAAARIHSFEAQVVPGLLQIPDYATALFRAARPNITNELLTLRLEVRERRQSLLIREGPVDLWVILDESIFRRMVGGTEVMSAQLKKLLELAQEPHITVQVMPDSAGAHAGMEGSFSILEYDENIGSDVVFAENAVGGLFLEKEADLEHYRTIFDLMRDSALTAERSLDLIAERAKELQ